jgi:hypothetical protein
LNQIQPSNNHNSISQSKSSINTQENKIHQYNPTPNKKPPTPKKPQFHQLAPLPLSPKPQSFPSTSYNKPPNPTPNTNTIKIIHHTSSLNKPPSIISFSTLPPTAHSSKLSDIYRKSN